MASILSAGSANPHKPDPILRLVAFLERKNARAVAMVSGAVATGDAIRSALHNHGYEAAGAAAIAIMSFAAMKRLRRPPPRRVSVYAAGPQGR